MARPTIDFGKLFKKARLEKNLSQREVARKVGLNSGQMISNIERNKTLPPPRMFNRLNRTLGISVNTLIDMTVKNYRERITEMVD